MKVYELNQGEWGVCGFVAATQAAYLNNKSGVEIKAQHYDTLFPIIKSFCVRNQDIEAELLKFSEVFGDDYRYKNIEKVIVKMETNKAMSGEKLGIAMTGKAMSRLCQELGFKNHDFHGTTSTTKALNLEKLPYKNTIYGLGRTNNRVTKNFRYGLLHWIYVDINGVIMTWGKSGPDAVEELTTRGYDFMTHYLPALN